MKLFVVSILLAVVAADRLENTYLPPNSAKTAGGNGNFLNAPSFGQNNAGVSDKYGAPAGGRYEQGPSSNYGAPSSNNYQQGGFGGGAEAQKGPDAGAAILKFDSENNGDGSYRFEYETENKIQHQEAGELKNQGTEQEAQSVEGSYSYMGPDGVTYTVNYIADENGFRATGDHIPTPPPIPEAIQKSLEQNAAAEASNDQGYQGNNGYQNGNGNGNGYQSNGNGNGNGNGYQNGGNNGYQNGNGKANGNGYQNGNGNGNGNGYQSNGNGNGNGYQSNGNGNGNGYQNGNGNGYQNGQNKYQGNQGASSSSSSSSSRQYIPPNKPSFNQQNGYQY